MAQDPTERAQFAKIGAILEIDGLATAAAAHSGSLAALEAGGVLFLPRLSYPLSDAERRFLTPEISDGKAKNVSFDPASQRCGGTRLTGDDCRELAAMMARFADWATALVGALLPRYAPGLQRGLTSLRPSEVEGRPASVRKDDTRLHIDAFPSQPVQGRRILRVFANLAAADEPRVWQVGEPFADFAARFLPRVKPAAPLSAWLMQRFGITKSYRTPYDHAMLRLHDLAKEDEDYQRTAPRTTVAFPGGTSWIVCTDATLHAAMSGRHAFEQTFFYDIARMAAPERSPLRILERQAGHALA